ncbi:major facilitator superfamily domain-containing protein 9-like [Agrilus planipennis]|uniref:Major facilitator superfamily domain-containing protein 9-like n=1 Tax=Agrilus planipennis TaxID=224129 RepID=A0A1W4XKB4_AGRPL|nr:major facilitator superfamily domain-containing protein 9-like [Agrilus planipennis]
MSNNFHCCPSDYKQVLLLYPYKSYRESKTECNEEEHVGDFESRVVRASDKINSDKARSYPSNIIVKSRTKKRRATATIDEMRAAARHIIYSVSFLDSLCFGLIVPLLTPRILSLGGSHTVAGIFISLQILCQLLSVPLINSFSKKFGYKSSLQKMLLINLITLYLLGLTESCFNLILIRSIYSLTNQTVYLCINILKEIMPKEEHFNIANTLHASSVGGFVVGAVSGGYLFELYGFWEVCLVSCGFNFGAIVLLKNRNAFKPLQQMQEKDDKSSSGTKESISESTTKRSIIKKSSVLDEFVDEVYINIASAVVNFDSDVFSNQLFLFLSHFLFTLSGTIFFTKYPILLKVNYNASAVIIGYTVAYQRMIIFVVNFTSGFIKSYFSLDKIDNIVNVFFMLNIGFIGLCFAPLYEIYLLCFIPMIVAKTIVNDFWRSPTVVVENKRESIGETLDVLGKLTEVIIPSIFGVFCDMYLELALQVFVLVPLMTMLIFLPFTDRGPLKDSVKTKVKKND